MDTKNRLIPSRNRELEAVLEVSRVLTGSFDLHDNLTAAMETLSSMLDLERGCVFLRDEETDELRIVAAHGLSSDEISRGIYKSGEGIVGSVIESGQPMFIPDIGDEPKFLNRTGSRPTKKGISFICVPIVLKSTVMGVISVDHIYAEERGSVDDDLRVLGIVSSFIAQFVELWRAYRRADRDNENLRAQLRTRYSLPNLVGESDRFQAVLKSVMKVAATNATVLLLGETGTGKEFIASTIHFQSPRANKPFVAVNCAALPANLLEVELFGCEKGAFTGATARRIGRFEAAEGGTIFLDEIGELDVELQAKLLRVLQERTYERVGSSRPLRADVRIIAATNRDLIDGVRNKTFRSDLYWRLNVVPIVLPPLRARHGDVRLLAKYFMSKYLHDYKKRITLSEAALEALDAYSWPGNIRELANIIERAVIMTEGDTIKAEDIPLGSASREFSPHHEPMEIHQGGSLRDDVVTLERQRMLRALSENSYVQHRAAKALGITPRQFGYRLKKYGIDPDNLKHSI